ncbi:MAG TPA: DUF1501 domain-containing protein [Blastocatellia bacterium]|nr:DUF1501 domain-containing protein [Blastocatellia bacterium]
MAIPRRTFIKRSGGFLGGAMFASSFQQFNLVNVLAQKGGGGPAGGPTAADPEYKALVCIFMFGGNDPNNTVVPIGTNTVLPNTNYSDYSSVRAALSIPEASLLPITPSTAPHAGITFGLNPGLSALLPIWSAGDLAVVCNVGTLFQPLTRTQYLNNSIPRPEFLFSHEDQERQWQTAVVRNTLLSAPTGWGGRLADNTMSLNPPGAEFPMIVSTGGVQMYTTGVSNRPLVPSSGLTGFANPRSSDPRYIAMQDLMAMDRNTTLVDFASETMQRAILSTDELNVALNDTTTVTRVFPNTGIGTQMRNVARTIARGAGCGSAARLFGNLKRQIFFCSIGGFDAHTNQIASHNSLLPQLGAAMAAFYNATVDLGIQSQVTAFTLSDFGRTLRPTDTGTDHAWGSHHFAMGGAVNGGTFYGTYPRLVTGAGTGNGSDDTGSEGRWIPTTAVDQYGATLATWFGLPAANLATVFPNIGNFATQNLGFLS